MTALVASGTNAGVGTSPWARRSVPARARDPGSRWWISKPGTGAEPTRPVARAEGRGPTARAPRRLASGGRRGLAALDGLLAAVGDGDPARLALLGLRDADLEHPAVEARRHGVGVDALGQRQRAGEGAERALHPVEALLALLVLGLALTRDGQRAVLELDLDVLRHAGQVGAEDEVVTGLDEV